MILQIKFLILYTKFLCTFILCRMYRRRFKAPISREARFLNQINDFCIYCKFPNLFFYLRTFFIDHISLSVINDLSKGNYSATKVFDFSSVKGSQIKGFGHSTPQSFPDLLQFPVYYVKLKNCFVSARSKGFIEFGKSRIFYPDVKESNFGKAKDLDGLNLCFNLDLSKCVFFPDKNALNKVQKIESGIHLLGSNFNGFGHFHYEHLPRAIKYLDFDIPIDVPLLVPTILHPQIKEALNLVFKKRTIIEVEGYADVKNLYFLEKLSYFAGDDRLIANPSLKQCKRQEQLLLLKDYIDNTIHGDFSKGEKILVLRNNNVSRRICKNLDEVVSYCLEKGYKLIYPHEYSFAEQVSIFKNAKKIVGQQGSQMDFMLYGDLSEKKVLFFHGDTVGNFNYIHNLFQQLGLEIRYVFGNAASRAWIQSPFEIDIKLLQRGLNWLDS